SFDSYIILTHYKCFLYDFDDVDSFGNASCPNMNSAACSSHLSTQFNKARNEIRERGDSSTTQFILRSNLDSEA
ncbi:hypothetical protein scyTo_0022128, partial [Scyliorhinus torazame]|nr:hypothetical protein [Scyliorhinus torazame]